MDRLYDPSGAWLLQPRGVPAPGTGDEVRMAVSRYPRPCGLRQDDALGVDDVSAVGGGGYAFPALHRDRPSGGVRVPIPADPRRRAVGVDRPDHPPRPARDELAARRRADGT